MKNSLKLLVLLVLTCPLVASHRSGPPSYEDTVSTIIPVVNQAINAEEQQHNPTFFTYETERSSALKYLFAQTKSLKNLDQFHTGLTYFALPTVITATTLLSGNKVSGFFSACLYSGAAYVASCAVNYLKKWQAQNAFKKLYNKKVDKRGNLFGKFSDEYIYGQPNTPYALNAQDFIIYARAAGYSYSEIVTLARKQARIDVLHQMMLMKDTLPGFSLCQELVDELTTLLG